MFALSLTTRKEINNMALTPKQEKFCQGVVQGMSQADAYRAAYNAEGMKPETIQQNASRLIKSSKIAARVEELRAPVVEECRLTLRNHLDTLEQLRDVAKDSGTIAAAVRAEELRGKASGLYTENMKSLEPMEPLSYRRRE